MAWTIRQGFERLRENIQITSLQETKVSTRQRNVRDVVKQQMSVLDSFLTGSYRRNTMIAPLYEADVDIFIVLDSSYYKPDGQAFLLDKVRNSLKVWYPEPTQISRNGQAVTIAFSDFQVDVVPAFHRQGGGYLIPDSILKRWIATDPKQHIEIWSAANKVHNGNLIPLIKMLKRWNKYNGAPLRSFHLEVLLIQILSNVQISDFPSGVRYVFDKAKTHILSPTTDPAGYGGDVGTYLNGQDKLKVMGQLLTTYLTAVEAEQLEAQGKTRQAYDNWRLIFGNYFPTYG